MLDRRPIIDELFSYQGLHATSGITRLRLFDTEPPILIVGELADNPGPSVTNAAEYLWPAILKHYLPHRLEHVPPGRFIELYPALEARGRRGKDEYSEVLFAQPTPRVVIEGGRPRLSYGEPTWQPMPEHELRRLLTAK
ncbi:MAG TPA: hypothetical protein VNL71_13285 [Chloroflexota bacterium]|nr:hypothetical protein [Chloroflexota bacterium]